YPVHTNRHPQPLYNQSASGDGYHLTQLKKKARLLHRPRDLLREECVPVGLEQTQHDGEVARPLRELFPALLVALHLVDDREHGRGQLEDDARRDVRHDAERKHRRAAEAAAREQVVQAEERALTLVPQEVGEGLHVHAGGRDVRPNAVHDQAQEREEDLLLQLRDLEQVGQSRCGHRGGQLAMVPPACSIFERADADSVAPFTLNLRSTSPMPSSLIGWSGRRTSPAPTSVSGVTSTPSATGTRWRTLTT